VQRLPVPPQVPGHLGVRLFPQGLPELVAGLAQLEVGLYELAQHLRLLGFLLSFSGLSHHVLAKPGLSQNYGRFLADGLQGAGDPWPKRLAALLPANAVLDEKRRLAACEFANAEAGQLVVKSLDVLGAFGRLQTPDELIGELDHVGLPGRNEKVRSVVR
jgi:hypothetical protein